MDEFGGFGGPSGSTSTRPVVPPINTGNTARPGSRGNPSRPGSRGNPAKRLTITNANPDEIYSEGAGGSRQQGAGGAQKQWPTAEEEKRLYEQARTRVAAVHGPEAAPPPVQRTNSPPMGAGGSSIPAGAAQPKPRYPTAEEEKVMLFNKAQAAVLNKQGGSAGIGLNQAGGSSHNRTPSDPKPSGAQLYQQAMAARKNPPPTQAMPIQSNPAPPSFNSTSNVPAYRSAQEEKAALRRYEEARQAVDRTHGVAGPPEGGSSSGSGAGRDSAPISYDALFPEGVTQYSSVVEPWLYE
ncbi:hypothetical protein NMY22_g8909 [Coprinellus aureogranulatus]|nr:hypothetical protein NMY22_g8909 [Coprinellus aureogranulatus]